MEFQVLVVSTLYVVLQDMKNSIIRYLFTNTVFMPC